MWSWDDLGLQTCFRHGRCDLHAKSVGWHIAKTVQAVAWFAGVSVGHDEKVVTLSGLPQGDPGAPLFMTVLVFALMKLVEEKVDCVPTFERLAVFSGFGDVDRMPVIPIVLVAGHYYAVNKLNPKANFPVSWVKDEGIVLISNLLDIDYNKIPFVRGGGPTAASVSDSGQFGQNPLATWPWPKKCPPLGCVTPLLHQKVQRFSIDTSVTNLYLTY